MNLSFSVFGIGWAVRVLVQMQPIQGHVRSDEKQTRFWNTVRVESGLRRYTHAVWYCAPMYRVNGVDGRLNRPYKSVNEWERPKRRVFKRTAVSSAPLSPLCPLLQMKMHKTVRIYQCRIVFKRHIPEHTRSPRVSFVRNQNELKRKRIGMILT